jgi:4,5-dihydroxyphthalate decarboxylase
MTIISLALDRYDRHLPFFDGTIEPPPGIDLSIIQAGEAGTLRDGADRHGRMLQEGEFDAAEVSFSSYIMAKARGLPFTAIPAFPRRLFSQTQMFVPIASDITEPGQLAGKRVGLQSFQTTLAVLAKGDLAHEYGVDLKSIHWVVRSGETIPFEPGEGWTLEYIAADADLGVMLADGQLDAMFFSRVPSTLATGKARRLFPDPREACADFYDRNKFFPIMHIVAIRDDIVAQNPDLPRALLDCFKAAKQLADGYRDDPGWSQLPWARLTMEEQEAAMARDLWPIGVAANQSNLERFLGYSFSQGLIDRELAVDDLFHESVRDS